MSLFVGRDAESERLLGGIGSAPSSRQVVQGAPGVGKTTLVQHVKEQAARAGVLSAPEPVSVGHADSAETVYVRVLSAVYEAVLANGDFTTKALEPLETARQLVRAFRVRSIGANVSLPGLGGVGGSTGKQYVTPSTAQPSVVVPGLLRQLADVAREHLGAVGLLVHLNNLENLTEADAEHAGAIVRDLRDTCLLAEGYHWLLVGTTDAMRTVVAAQPQVRSVFAVPQPLAPLAVDELHALLARRYEYLRLDATRPVRAPVEAAAVADLYALFRGNLRGTFRALDEAAHELVGYGPRNADAPMTAADVRAVLRQRYAEELAASLPEALADYLRRLADRGPGATFTQRELVDAWRVTQSAVSQTLGALQRHGYVAEVERREAAGRGRPQTGYALTGAARLSFDEP
ncbi:MAG TPA: AAA family ATPase, partial [Gemmatirosa sp.]